MSNIDKKTLADDKSVKTYYIHPMAFGSTQDPGHGHVPVVKADEAEKRIAEQREYYEGVIADGSRRIAELEAEKAELRPVGVMSEKAFYRLKQSESRFIALWPRPGIHLPRKRPHDSVIVYARVATAGIGKGE